MRSVAEVTTTVPAWLTARAAPSPTSTTGSDWRSAAVTSGPAADGVDPGRPHAPGLGVDGGQRAAGELEVPHGGDGDPAVGVELGGDGVDQLGGARPLVDGQHRRAVLDDVQRQVAERSAKTTLSSWLIGLLIRP